MMARLKYTLLLWLLLPYVFFHLLWRGRKQREYLQHVGERFGRYRAQPGKPVIWLHTVSVGETRAAASLVRRLRSEYPKHQLLLTHTTPTGREESERLYGDEVMRVYLPYDYPFAVYRFIRHFKPDIGVLMETEIWPNLIQACHESHTPLLLINARLSEKSARRYARYPNLTRRALEELAGIAAQTAVDARRLELLGAGEVEIMGNLKFDIEQPVEMQEQGRAWRKHLGETRPVFLAASTREGEEALLLDALQAADVADMLTVIVPRHPQRFEEVAALLNKRGIEYVRRSAGVSVSPNVSVVLGDSMGEMYAYYAACDIAFVGGSLLPFGGQNLIEACASGKPVLIGEHTYNFADATEEAVASGAAIRVRDAKHLLAEVRALIGDTSRMGEMSRACYEYARGNRGATDRAMGYIRKIVHGVGEKNGNRE